MDVSKKTALTNEEIEDILNKDLVDLLGIEEMPEEEREKFRETAITTIENKGYARILKMLEKMGKVEEYKNATDINKFFEENKINLDLIFAEETLLYKLKMRAYSKVINDGFLAKKTTDGGK